MWTLESAQQLSNIFQNVTLVIGAAFTSWWAYSTFGHKEKTEELTTIARKIIEIDSHIQNSITNYKLYETLLSLGSYEESKLHDFKLRSQAKLDVLLSDLQELQYLSFRVPVGIRVLDLIEYTVEVRSIGQIESWSNKANRDKMLKIKHELLHRIEKEINAHRNFFLWVGRKLRNAIFLTKNIFSRTQSPL